MSLQILIVIQIDTNHHLENFKIKYLENSYILEKVDIIN